MNDRSAIILKALLSKGHQGRALLQFLSEKDKPALEKAITPDKINFASLLSFEEWIKPIHYSWFVPLLAPLPSPSQALLLNFFDQHDQTKLKEMLGLSLQKVDLAPFSRPFLSNYLKKKLFPEEILPLPLLPPSPLNELLYLSKEELTHIIDLLGLHDLAAELRHIVDKNLLTKIHSSLNPTQLQFLHYATKQPMKWTPPKMNLDKIEIDKKTIASLLHKRGLFRLAMGVAHEEASYKWHLVHHLDTGRGDYLMKLFAGKEDPAMITFFRGQVLHLLQRVSFQKKV